LGSDGDIRIVIGIDVDLKNTTAGWVSVWEPRIVKNEVGEDELVAQQTTVTEVCVPALSFGDIKSNVHSRSAMPLEA